MLCGASLLRGQGAAAPALHRRSQHCRRSAPAAPKVVCWAAGSQGPSKALQRAGAAALGALLFSAPGGVVSADALTSPPPVLEYPSQLEAAPPAPDAPAVAGGEEGGITDEVSQTLREITDMLLSSLRDAADQVKGTAERGSSALQERAGQGAEAAAEAGSAVGGAAKGLASQAADKAAQAAGATKQAAEGAAGGAAEGARSAAEGAKALLRQGGSKAEQAAEGGKGALEQAQDAVEEAVEDAARAVKEGAEQAGSALKGSVQPSSLAEEPPATASGPLKDWARSRGGCCERREPVPWRVLEERVQE